MYIEAEEMQERGDPVVRQGHKNVATKTGTWRLHNQELCKMFTHAFENLHPTHEVLHLCRSM